MNPNKLDLSTNALVGRSIVDELSEADAARTEGDHLREIQHGQTAVDLYDTLRARGARITGKGKPG